MSQDKARTNSTYKPPHFLIRLSKRLLITLLLGGLLYGAWEGFLYWKKSTTPPPHYKKEVLKQEDFDVTIEATGTLEPEDLIDVGAQVGGIIQEFGQDAQGKTVDYGSIVKEGEVLARIDDVLVKSDIKKAQAAVSQAQAAIAVAEAELEDSKARYELAQSQKARAERLGPSEALAQSAYETYISNEKAAKANLALKEASIDRAKATLMEAEANLERQDRNLTYTTIVAPVDGTVIARKVNIGQTVVSSMSAPSLFLLAKDLKKLEIWAAVNEADIGLVKEGQEVTYTVDAFPKKTFKGTVQKIRLDATMTSNVVTYIVEVTAPNPDLTLIPFLTANTKFIVRRYPNALTVSNAALKWTPSLENIAPNTPVPNGDRIWVQEGNFVTPIEVKVKETNGTISVIESSKLKAGMPIIVGMNKTNMEDSKAAAEGQQTTNPFAPKMPSRRRSNSGGGSQGGPPPH